MGKYIKKILLPIFSLFLLYRSYEIMKGLLVQNNINLSLIESLLIAFLLTLFITGIFAFIGFAYTSSSLLPDKYYRIKNPQFLERVYKGFGVKYFRVLLLIFFWGRGKNRKKFFDGSRKGIENMLFQTKQSEFGHLAAFWGVTLCIIPILFKGYFLLVLFAVIINIIGNFYPIILQRQHRIRIQNIHDRYGKGTN